jgi:hypothetical protein
MKLLVRTVCVRSCRAIASARGNFPEDGAEAVEIKLTLMLGGYPDVAAQFELLDRLAQQVLEHVRPRRCVATLGEPQRHLPDVLEVFGRGPFGQALFLELLPELDDFFTGPASARLPPPTALALTSVSIRHFEISD